MSSLDKRLLAAGGLKGRKAGQIIAALDLGATKIACLIVRTTETTDGGGFELLGHGQQSSRGLKGGSVIDMDGLERSVRLAVEDAERMAGLQINSVRLAVSGPSQASLRVQANLDMAGREVTQKDVQKLLDRGLAEASNDKYQILHAVPFSYSIDGNDGVRDPRGMFADTLGVTMNIVVVPRPIYKNLVLCVSRAHLEVESVSAGAFMSANAVLVEDECDNGAICIDMGGGSTGISVYLNGTLAHLESIQVGGHHVTSDISQGIGTTIPAAERIKTLHGSVLPVASTANDMIEAPRIGDDGRLQAARMSRAELKSYIEPRLEEIFELISAKLSKSGLGGRLPRRAVLTGGASEMPGMRELASRVLAMPVRLGRPTVSVQLGEDCQRPVFSSAAGLLTFDHSKGGDPKAVVTKPQSPSGPPVDNGLMGRAFDWLKENF